jgi:hypothetical protein
MPRKQRTIIDEVLDDKDKANSSNDDIVDITPVLYKVYKINGVSRSFCCQSVESLDELAIQNQYPNGGKFEIHVFNSAGETIDKQAIDIEPKPQNMMTAIPNGNGHVSGQSDIQVRMLLDELQFSRQMILQMLANKGGGSEQTSVTELITGMQGLHALTSQKDPVELLVKGMELGKSNSGSFDWKESLINTVREVAVPALSAIGSMRASPAQTFQANGPMPQVQLPPADVIKSGLIWLKSKILKGLDPGLAVDMLIMNADDPKYQPILTLAIRGSIENFVELDSEIENEPFKTWFTNAIQLLKDWYAEQNNDGGNMERGNGNGPDVAIDAKSGTRKLKVAKAV